ncbi:cell division protein FtsQ [Aureimonas endophytica]|uniref:Cell division protein FtsQ n=1 Tax=Aureimonas endophytica TaxID=2027858 RepID=A0A916ZFL9_9HYPH|nr:cell division protein FtsQ/DivIB [Aureimonas endophytica]GGD92283.1 cell division protein FtsQ [Aureimonas endophytica]
MPALNRGERAEPVMERSLGRRRAFRLSYVGRRLAALGQILSRTPLPNFATLATVVLGSTTLYGMSIGGHATGAIDSVAQPLGFSIDKVDVAGNTETSEIDVLQALWSTGAQSLPALDVEAARRTLEAMPWIDKAAVAKTYPDRVSISLVEKKPFALWQKGGELAVIDRQGRDIMPYLANRFQSLPFVVGPGADVAAAQLLDGLEKVPELRARVKAYIRVGDRRWDLRLDNGVTVRLPEEGAVEAAADVVRMDKEMGLLSRDIAVVDMRIADRVTVRLTPEAVTRRDAAVKERDKLIARSKKEKPA